MSYSPMPELTPAQKICCTSVQDGCLTVSNTSDTRVLADALKYEKSHMGRSTLVRRIENRIAKLEARRRRMPGR